MKVLKLGRVYFEATADTRPFDLRWRKVAHLLRVCCMCVTCMAACILQLPVYAACMLDVCCLYAARMLCICCEYVACVLPICCMHAACMLRVCCV